MSPDQLMDLVDAWTRWGWLRALDRAFCRFLHRRQPDTAAEVLLAATLVSHQAGRGHLCLEVPALFDRPEAVLGLPPEGEGRERRGDGPAAVLNTSSKAAFLEALGASPLVAEGDGDTPLVLSGGRLYLRRFWHCEQQVARHIAERIEDDLPVPDDLPQRLDRLFAHLRTPDQQTKNRVHWQSVAAAIAVRSRFCIISGGPGAGKTTTVVHLLGLLQEMSLAAGKPLRIQLAAPTGKAAARLSESMGRTLAKLPEALQTTIPTEAATLHRLLGSRPDTRRFAHDVRNPLHVDLLVVDEASMIDLEMMSALLEALKRDARLILLGDKDQLASVEAGAVLGDLCRNADRVCLTAETGAYIAEATGYVLDDCPDGGSRLDQRIVVLRDSHRFGADSGIGALARAVNAGDPEQVAAVWNGGYGDIDRLAPQTADDRALTRLLLGDDRDGHRPFLERLGEGPGRQESVTQWARSVLALFGRFQVLAAVRRGDWGVSGLNAHCAAVLQRAGFIPAVEGWYPGRPVMLTRNDYTLGLMNGDVGITLPSAGIEGGVGRGELRVVFSLPDGSLKWVAPSRLGDAETVFAMTVHKSQGSEFDHAVLVLPDTPSAVLTRELVYTGVTRASRRFTLVAPRPELLEEAVGRRTLRASGLADRFADPGRA